MFKRNRFWKSALAVGVVAAALTGCKIESDVDLFVSDVFLISETGEHLQTSARVKIEAGSESSCNENKHRAQDLLSKYYPIKESAVCQTEGFDTFMAFRLQVPVMRLPEGSFELPENAPTALGLKELPTGSVEVYGLVSPSRFAAMEANFEELSSVVSLKISSVQVTLTNDNRSSHKVFGPASWVNDQPNWGPTIDLQQRDRVEWRTSDVGVAFLSSNNFVWLMTIEP